MPTIDERIKVLEAKYKRPHTEIFRQGDEWAICITETVDFSEEIKVFGKSIEECLQKAEAELISTRQS